MYQPIVRKLDHRASIFVGLSLLLSAARLDAATPAVKIGTEFRVNSNTSGVLAYPTVAGNSSGGFVVVWTDYSGIDGSDRGIFARRFGANGTALASEFQVNSYTPGAQAIPSARFDASNRLVVVWTGYGDQDGSGNGIFGRRYDSAGVPQAAEFQVNTYTTGNQLQASLAMDTAGDFVVAWTSLTTNQDGSGDGVFFRRYNAAGAPLTSDVQANVFTTGSQQIGRVASDADGDFVVVWISNGQDGSATGVFGRRFDAAGAPKGAEFQINSYTAGGQTLGTVSLDPDGDFVVDWSSYSNTLARRFDSAGNALAAEFQVNVDAAGYAGRDSIGHNATGDFVITWQAIEGGGGGQGVRLRQFDSNGIPLTTELQVNTYTTLNQVGAAVATTSGGNFVVVWYGPGEGDPAGIFAQRFRSPVPLDVDGNGTVEALTDALLILRDSFGFTGNTLVSGAVDLANCTRCTAPEIQAYLATMK